MNKIFQFILFSGFLSGFVSHVSALDKTRFFPAGHPAIQYMGRVEQHNNQACYNWPGVTVTIRFTGSVLGIRIKGGDRNYFNVWLDKQLYGVIHAVQDTVWWVPGNLASGMHQLRLIKRTEADMGMAVFYGLYTGEKDSLLRPLPSPGRKLLFIGNSITCGYGTEGGNKSEHFKPSTENCEKSYATILARAFYARYQLVSHSGLGMVRNYGHPDKLSEQSKTMPARFDYLFDNDSSKKYKLNDFRPDAVVINLGTNDFSTQPFPDEADFTGTGIKLINKILDSFPGVKVFCITGPMINEPCYSYTKKMTELVRTNRKTKDVVFIGVPVDLLNDDSDLGSDWHPSYRGQAKIASLILPVMENVLNWSYSDEEIERVLTQD